LTFLLDTVVLSEPCKPARQRNQNLVRWIGEVPSSGPFISEITIGEIERGIDRQRETGLAFSQRLESWLESIVRTYEDRILVVVVAGGRLSPRIGNTGLDLAIAATVLEHGLVVVARFMSDFQPAGVSIPNPFDSSRIG
jgi:predicted nucleic acid-binding protein